MTSESRLVSLIIRHPVFKSRVIHYPEGKEQSKGEGIRVRENIQ